MIFTIWIVSWGQAALLRVTFYMEPVNKELCVLQEVLRQVDILFLQDLAKMAQAHMLCHSLSTSSG